MKRLCSVWLNLWNSVVILLSVSSVGCLLFGCGMLRLLMMMGVFLCRWDWFMIVFI